MDVIKLGPLTTSRVEAKEIFKAWIAVTLIFAIALSSSLDFVAAFLIAFFCAGLGVILHELAHKLVAQHYGCHAEFRSFPFMLFISIILALFGVIFLAPGAVFITGPVGRRRNGMISSAGIAANIAMGIVFFLLLPIQSMSIIAKYGLMINGWLALFNLIPFGPFDGKKVFNWNKIVFGGLVILSLVVINWETFSKLIYG